MTITIDLSLNITFRHKGRTSTYSRPLVWVSKPISKWQEWLTKVTATVKCVQIGFSALKFGFAG